MGLGALGRTLHPWSHPICGGDGAINPVAAGYVMEMAREYISGSPVLNRNKPALGIESISC